MTSRFASRVSLLASRFSLTGVIVLLVAGSVLAWASLRGWYPHDEGLLGQSAERVLRGEVPHRDFDDPYTGGLALLHAAAFAIFGIKLTVLRYLVAITAVAWIVGVFAVRSCTVRILAVVTGHTVSQRVKMKLTIVTWPRSDSSLSSAPV